MKPLVYFDFEEYDGDNNLVLVDKRRLQEILEEVYSAGFADGSKANTVTAPTYGNLRYPLREDQLTCGELCTNSPVPKRVEYNTGIPAPRRGVTITCDTESTNKS